MDWFEDDEMMRHWEEVSKEEGKTTLKRNEGKGVKSGKSANCAIADRVTFKKEAKKGKEEKKVASWTTERMEEVRSKRAYKDTEEMVAVEEHQRRSRSRRGSEWTRTTVGGSASCWPLTAKKAFLHPEWDDTMQQWSN